jgi:hypothetical protein
MTKGGQRTTVRAKNLSPIIRPRQPRLHLDNPFIRLILLRTVSIPPRPGPQSLDHHPPQRGRLQDLRLAAKSQHPPGAARKPGLSNRPTRPAAPSIAGRDKTTSPGQTGRNHPKTGLETQTPRLTQFPTTSPTPPPPPRSRRAEFPVQQPDMPDPVHPEQPALHPPMTKDNQIPKATLKEEMIRVDCHNLLVPQQPDQFSNKAQFRLFPLIS